MLKDDWLERQMAGLAALVARVLGAKTVEEADREVEGMAGLGLDLAEKLDAASLAATLGHDPARLAALAAGLDRRAADADPARAARLREKAEALRTLAAGR